MASTNYSAEQAPYIDCFQVSLLDIPDVEEDCMICLEPITAGQIQVRHNPCHTTFYHKACLDEWSQGSWDDGKITICPYCKTRIKNAPSIGAIRLAGAFAQILNSNPNPRLLTHDLPPVATETDRGNDPRRNVVQVFSLHMTYNPSQGHLMDIPDNICTQLQLTVLGFGPTLCSGPALHRILVTLNPTVEYVRSLFMSGFYVSYISPGNFQRIREGLTVIGADHIAADQVNGWEFALFRVRPVMNNPAPALSICIVRPRRWPVARFVEPIRRALHEYYEETMLPPRDTLLPAHAVPPTEETWIRDAFRGAPTPMPYFQILSRFRCESPETLRKARARDPSCLLVLLPHEIEPTTGHRLGTWARDLLPQFFPGHFHPGDLEVLVWNRDTDGLWFVALDRRSSRRVMA